MNKVKNQNLTPREQLLQKYNSTRVNLILAVALTVANIVLYIAGSETMMLFSASIPFYAVIIGSAVTVPAFAIIFYAIAAVSLVVYLLSWIFSKKRFGWLIPALVFFVIDTVVMIVMYIWAEDFSGVMDIVLHAYILYSLFVGVISGSKLKKMPPEEVEAPVVEVRETVDPEHWAE